VTTTFGKKFKKCCTGGWDREKKEAKNRKTTKTKRKRGVTKRRNRLLSLFLSLAPWILIAYYVGENILTCNPNSKFVY